VIRLPRQSLRSMALNLSQVADECPVKFGSILSVVDSTLTSEANRRHVPRIVTAPIRQRCCMVGFQVSATISPHRPAPVAQHPQNSEWLPEPKSQGSRLPELELSDGICEVLW
jgi:hypothetical protein